MTRQALPLVLTVHQKCVTVLYSVGPMGFRDITTEGVYVIIKSCHYLEIIKRLK